MSQIKSKIWKQLIHVKNEQIKDNDSSISNSRSMNNCKFAKVKFNKIQRKQQKKSRADSVKQFKAISAINNYSRQKYTNNNNNHNNNNNMSILNESKQRIIDNSLNSSYHKQNIQSQSKNKQSNKNINKSSSKQLNMKIDNFMNNIKNIYIDIKEITQHMIEQFEKIKEDMQNHMQKIVMEIVNIKINTQKNNKDNQSQEVNNIHNHHLINQINQIFRIGFLSIKKNINILPESFYHLNSNIGDHLINTNINNNNIQNSHNSNSNNHSNNPQFPNSTPKQSNFNPKNQISRYFKKQLAQYNSTIKPTPNTKILNEQSRKNIIQQMHLIDPNDSIYHAITQRKNIKKIQRMSSFNKQLDQSPIQKFKKYQIRQNNNMNNIYQNNHNSFGQSNIKKKLIDQITITKRQDNSHQLQQYTYGLKNAVYRLKQIIQFGQIS